MLLLIILLKVEPVIALVIGSLYLADEQPDLGHDLAESSGDCFERAGEADSAGQSW